MLLLLQSALAMPLTPIKLDSANFLQDSPCQAYVMQTHSQPV
jgi:hypothetical protein